MDRLRLWCIGVIALGAAIGCGDAVQPLPIDAVELASYNVPPQYLMWWQATESCSGLSAQYRDVRWYYIPGASRVDDPHFKDAAAAWYAAQNAIVIASHWLDSGSVVRHEMLHAISKRGHTAALFRDACGALVDCEESCLTDIGPQAPVPSSAAIVQPSALEVSVDYFPKPYVDPTNVGYLLAIVSAKNTASTPVRVALARGLGSVYATTFQFQLNVPRRNETASTTDSTINFLPGETKRVAFDLRSVFMSSANAPQATGLFNGVASTAVKIDLP
ncbi:MAG TPA: hypothetical protein VF483_04675 [Gemmatimonadaceae bacterium]